MKSDSVQAKSSSFWHRRLKYFLAIQFVSTSSRPFYIINRIKIAGESGKMGQLILASGEGERLGKEAERD